MNLISLITKGMILAENVLAALTWRLDEGVIKIISGDRKTRIRMMKKLKEELEERGHNLYALTMKFRSYSGKPVFMKAGVFFNRMNSYRVIYDLVAIYDEYGDEIDVEGIMEAMMYEGIFGDDGGDELDFGGFSGWD